MLFQKPVLLLLLIPSLCLSQTPDTVFLEDLTWTEVRALLDGGTDTVIIPTAGTEQNGPHVVLGKHKYRMNAGADAIARKMGKTLVAPVIVHVPEGDIDPPSGHMLFPGTISIPEEVFQALIEHTVRSLKAHGFKKILLIGDSGGNQAGMKAVANRLNHEWQSDGISVLHVSAWYEDQGYRKHLASMGFSESQIGVHAGLHDTSTLLYIAPEHVRVEAMEPGKGFDIDGVIGDPTLATAELGETGFNMAVAAALAQIESELN
ncbi:creatininase family protein [Congregibacter variabilis]|uniref:Creatininase family protein n=1 Tax=Congregibacter variabilis TaxID=3081200 RepID=A0ABZ0I072_9GAMM|nr:creatininase family protein [Congregibacter sp. IMCC43200]